MTYINSRTRRRVLATTLAFSLALPTTLFASNAYAAPGVSAEANYLNSQASHNEGWMAFSIGEYADAAVGFTLPDKLDDPAHNVRGEYKDGYANTFWFQKVRQVDASTTLKDNPFTQDSTISFKDTTAREKLTPQGVWKIVENDTRLIFVPNDSIMNFRAERAQLAQRVDNIEVNLRNAQGRTETLSVGVLDAPAFYMTPEQWPPTQASRVFNPDFVRTASSPDEVLTWKLSEVFTSSSSVYLAAYSRWRNAAQGDYSAELKPVVDEENGVLTFPDVAGTWKIDENADLISYTPAPGKLGSTSNSFSFASGEYGHYALNLPLLFAVYPAPSTKDVTVTKVTVEEAVRMEELKHSASVLTNHGGELYIVENIPDPSAFLSSERIQKVNDSMSEQYRYRMLGTAGAYAHDEPISLPLHTLDPLKKPDDFTPFTHSPIGYYMGQSWTEQEGEPTFLTSVVVGQDVPLEGESHIGSMLLPEEALTPKYAANVKVGERYSVLVTVPGEEMIERLNGRNAERAKKILASKWWVHPYQSVANAWGITYDLFTVDPADKDVAEKLLNLISLYDAAVEIERTPAAEPSTEETPSAEPSTEETPATEPSTEETPVVEPSAETPEAEPSTETPAAEPSTETPAAEPSTETPEAEPSTETPAAEPSTEQAEQSTANTSAVLANTGVPVIALIAAACALITAAAVTLRRRFIN